ncbi:ABC-type thiamine transport system, periplasmic component [Thermococcus nautili]|uniref:thiamine ABC transporter substrate-binding protein n=1 Tax=Thermococcus nautili TaxID=195522 RepID=UPI002553A5AA|nr:thiamine ABC transporter substrate-binding protein [Thermococcus nautili]CAI1493610.1 ABC-type thiamine transport system, periplasmic component [Thermococcus nautili]
MRKVLALLVVTLFVTSLLGARPVKAEETLTVYSYESIEGWMKEIIPIFEKEYGVKVRLVTFGDAGEVLSKLIIEKNNPQADVVVGIDNSYLQKALQADILIPYKPENAKYIPEWIIKDFDPTFHLTPYDYGAIAIVYKKDVVKNPPKTFEDLTKPEWKGKLIVENPLTSSTGMAFFLWTIGVYGDKWPYYWEKLKQNDVIIVKGWGAGWEMWDKNQAPLFVSYATDPAYSACNYNDTSIGAIFLNDTAYVQIEGAGIVKGTKHLELAKEFINFLISKTAQEKLPLNQWMYPVNKEVKLPACFSYALNVSSAKVITIPSEELAKNTDKWLKEWRALMVEGKKPEEISPTPTSTAPNTNKTESSSSTGSSICGPGLIVGLAIVPLLLRRRP